MRTSDPGSEVVDDMTSDQVGHGGIDPFVVVDGVECYRLDDVDDMEPFLTTVVSDSDLWMFVSSGGSLTAGRIDADHAIFPYLTDDQIHRGASTVGPVTILARTVDGRRELWRPFHSEKSPGCRRSIAKSVLGDRLVFEEVNALWDVRVRATWVPSPSFGWVRTVEVADLGTGTELEVLDGVLDVMPSGVDEGTEQARSNLVDAFKRSELVEGTGRLAVYNLEALITDRAEPGEALTSTAVWSWGFEDATVDLDPRVIRRFLAGGDVDRRLGGLVTGRPGSYILSGPVRIPAGSSQTWSLVLDTGIDHSELAALVETLGDPDTPARLSDDVAAGSGRLRSLLAAADGMQRTADRIADVHHLSNVLFNSMRGGVFPYEQRLPISDLVDFVRVRNRPVAERHAEWFAGLGAWGEAGEVRSSAEATGDLDLVRLVLEYLPLTFSRRHGDPSRPWNSFSIHVTDDSGGEVLRYEGNWRDIFQNWEALLQSFPTYFPHVVAKFVNASTLDGYNPYRISREGVDWEVPDPHDPWVNIGYWGDHQIIYLLRLLEGWERFAPGAIASWLERPMFVYADVPYRISDRAQMIRDPRSTITFLDDRAAASAARESEIGTDGRLMVDAAGGLLRVGLLEKLLVPALSKLSNYIPGGGIWMNTQRPEWNDANNALAGPGVSMVTVFHLHRYLVFLRAQLGGRKSIQLSSPVAAWLDELAAVYRETEPEASDDSARRSMIDALGTVADAHGRRVLAGARSEPEMVDGHAVLAFIDAALAHLETSIEGANRPDGLVDSYNLVSFPDDSTATLRQLGPMLEGQVAALSCGLMNPDAALAVIDGLYRSEMYRSDLDTFMLYPAVDLAPFGERNVISPDALPADAEAAMPGVVARGVDGRLRFRPGAVTAAALEELMDRDDVAQDDRAVVRAAYEEVFDHDSFTGRSGSMYGYEGIGSVYWHMVSKLLLAVQEIHWTAIDAGADEGTIENLASAYRRVRQGLGFTKSPEVFGAFPTDCYSHSPAHSGAQQPGMTGQVKEEVLTRFGELGLRVLDGRLVLQPRLLPASELFGTDATQIVRFTFCSVPMEVRLGELDEVEFVPAGGVATTTRGVSLTAEQSAAVFDRAGRAKSVNWTVAR
jgi:hypothetical protein